MKKLVALVSVPLLALSLTACSGGDGASKEEVVKGFTKTMETYGLKKMGLDGLEEEVRDEYVTCIVDGAYDSLSPETRDVLAQGASEDISEMKISKKDKELLINSVENQKCIDIITKSLIEKESNK